MEVLIRGTFYGLSQEELRLVDRFVKAVDSINDRFDCRDGGYVLQGIISTNPLRCDFQLTSTSALGQAFTGPQLTLTEDVFEENKLTPEVLEQVQGGVQAFKAQIDWR